MRVFNICNNCFQINDGEWIYCQSYSSLVAMYSFKRSKLVLGRKWDYSKTTLKHLKLFLNRLTPDFENMTKKDILKLLDSGNIEYDDMLD